ncbi:tryptophan synthase subunit alpha [Candidatus Riflebacteria bacterium]
MKPIKEVFAKGPAFLAYLTAGDGGMDFSLAAFLALIEGGVDILEIGVPFSDPVADGPVIQRAVIRSLAEKTTPSMVLDLIREIRKKSNVPIVLFSYFNPILAAKKNNFFKEARKAGVDGLLTVDLPIEEASEYLSLCRESDISPVFVITPTTPIERIQLIEKSSNAFLYYACRKGTTGVRDSLPAGFAEHMQKIKEKVSVPVVAGFGISNKQMAAEVIRHADGFVVGSLFVREIEKSSSAEKLLKVAREIDPR